MNNKNKKDPISEQKTADWRLGYEMGMRVSLKENDEALQIGRAILAVLDKRYEFKEEDY